ncbi:hypothetical protein J4E90_003674 [Alternaria incomplexa]|uniref:uncharacterized protein n=1 Tax=Alternaria incomplexa TaxID=1187928 RepID=UPI00221EE6E8|nr:uncharacterized protein J4E90_003674 [Alternaria incomplexa]KAI4917167.1 hypothetical protein J4E90_003674 [Alternaria incomplexa]
MSPQMMAEYMRRQAISTQSQPRPTTMQAQPPTRDESQARLNRQFALFGMAYFQRLDPRAKQQFQQLPSQKQNEIVKNAIEKRKQQEIQKAREQQMAQQLAQQLAEQLAAQLAQQQAAQQQAAQQQAARQQAAQQAHFKNFVQQYVNSFSPERSLQFRQLPELQQGLHLRNVYKQRMQNARQLHQQKMQQMQQHQPARQLQQVSQPQQLAQQPRRILQTPEVQQHRQLQSPRILQAPQAQQHQEPQPQRIQQTQPAPQLKRPRSDDDEASPATKVAKVAQPTTEQQPKNTEDPDDQRLRSELTTWLASKQAEEEAQKSEQSAELHWQMKHAGPYPGYEPAKSNISYNSF